MILDFNRPILGHDLDSNSPFLVLVTDEKLVELLPLELELVLCVLLDGFLVSNGVILLE